MRLKSKLNILNRVLKINFLLFVVVSILFIDCQSHKESVDLLTFRGNTMGTIYAVKISNDNYSEHRVKEIKKGIRNLLVEINQQMSIFIPDSELSSFNRNKKCDWFPVSFDTARVFEQSIRISEKSNGAFDITAGTLVNLWGFGTEKKDFKIPSKNEIEDAMKLIDYNRISVKISPPLIKKEIPEIYCDLSAITKGYGVDKLSGYLDSMEILNYLIEIGGEIKARGKNHLNRPWRIGILTPDNKYGIQKTLLLKDTSMATSGDYHNYFEKDGVRYSHTIDPRTGSPITHKLVSVTVIHDSCMYADSMATAINVLGPEEGYRLAIKEHLPVFLIIRTKNGFIEMMTPEFKRILDL